MFRKQFSQVLELVPAMTVLYLPIPQILQADEACAPPYFPATQFKQKLLLGAPIQPLYLPRPQFTQVTEFVAPIKVLYLPWLHAVQTVEAEAPTVPVYLPAGQSVQ